MVLCCIKYLLFLTKDRNLSTELPALTTESKAPDSVTDSENKAVTSNDLCKALSTISYP